MLPQDFLQKSIDIWKRTAVAELWQPIMADNGVNLLLRLLLLVREERHCKNEHENCRPHLKRQFSRAQDIELETMMTDGFHPSW